MTLTRCDSGKVICILARLLKALLVMLLFFSPGWSQAPAPDNHATPTRPLPDFSYTQGWLGADDAYSVPIGKDRSLWLFGDTFVANSDVKMRSQYKAMVRNSVGVSTCRSGQDCTMNYFWQKPNTPAPRSFFDTGTDDLWYWPLDGFFDGKTLFVPMMAVRNKPNARSGDAFGFEIIGTKYAIVEDPEMSPERWHVSIHDLTDAHLWAGDALVADGKYVVWYTRVVEGEDGSHGYMTAMRVRRDKMANASSSWEYLRKDGRWMSGLAGENAMHVIEQPISEMSVRYHPTIRKWLALSIGPEFPSPRAVVRIADSPVGPWSAPQTVYEFPEMKRDVPGYDKDTFCYAVKEHIELTDAKIAMTYACNSMDVSKTIANMNIYRPKFVVLDIPK